MQMEGSKEWDRLGMKPKEYLVYFNSGMSLARWKALNRGRRGQILDSRRSWCGEWSIQWQILW